MNINCLNKRLSLEIDAPPSKSIYHRELIVRFLSGMCGEKSVGFDPTRLLEDIPGDSVDIKATKECLRALWKAESGKDVILPCHESGSTLRFLITVASAYLTVKAIDSDIIFTTEGRLFERPLDQLEECLKDHGVTISRNEEDRTIRVKGQMVPGKFVIDGSVSSQFISGILMAMPLFDGDNSVEVTNIISSIHYINLTSAVLRKYGVPSERDGKTFSSSTGYISVPEEDFHVEGDWSNGAFLICLGALLRGGGIKVRGLDMDTLQGDAAILGFLVALGIKVDAEGDVFTVRDQISGRLPLNERPEISWDCKDIPDIVPYMAVMGAFFSKMTVLKGISRLRIKESDRARAIRKSLVAAGFDVTEKDDSIIIYGGDPKEAAEGISLSSFNDHRMAMVAIMIAAALGADIEIDDISCLSKSFPGMIDVVKEEMN